ncbi:S-adenosylhomocysteine hydrolase [Vibrio sp. SM6]|uniref:S-adenosylhomocysteine hydrolase n=1 Tax=Vibrio agarilyticus TaxID=2726741 RepID=A0A7X8TRE5_9VIBR|nr:phage protein [Vibrio agarilyticus]NLS13369.1 S-adenosylhomocysteine hydrolase [Vibrio agarilyticus]
MLTTSFKTLFWQNFDSIRAGAQFFHVNPVTVKRWLNEEIPINPMAEKLLIIKAIGYLPNDIRWQGFRIDEERAIFITPTGRQFAPKELEEWVHKRDEYYLLVERHGHIDWPKIAPAKATLLPFRGGRRMSAAPWIPTKEKTRR